MRVATSWAGIGTACLLFSLALASPAASQESRPQPRSEWKIPLATPGTCTIIPAESSEEGVTELSAACNGRAIAVGKATSYQTVANEALQATLIDLHLGSTRRVLLLSAQADGVPLLEDLTGQVALAAGRGPMSGIDGVQLDLAQFAATGDVGVRGLDGDTGSHRADRVGLAPQIARARARIADSAGQGRK